MCSCFISDMRLISPSAHASKRAKTKPTGAITANISYILKFFLISHSSYTFVPARINTPKRQSKSPIIIDSVLTLPLALALAKSEITMKETARMLITQLR